MSSKTVALETTPHLQRHLLTSIGNTTGFPAQAGWDAVTGFGTPNFSKLVDAAFAKKGESPKGY